MSVDTPDPYAVEKLSDAVRKLGKRGDLKRRIHDASEGVMVVSPAHLPPPQAALHERIVSALTRKVADPAVKADDPRVMTNLMCMSNAELAAIERDIRKLHADVIAEFR